MTPSPSLQATPLAWASLLGVMAMPVLALGVQGGANAAALWLWLCALAGCLAYRQQVFPLGWPAPWRAMAWTTLLPVLAVLSCQWWLDDWRGRAFDGPSRMLLIAPGVAWLACVSRERVAWVFWALAGGAIVGCTVLAQAAISVGGRPGTSYATAITFGNLTLLMGVLALASLGWRQWRSPFDTGLKLLAGAAGLVGSLLSQSRGGWVAVPVLALVALFTYPLSGRQRGAVLLALVVALGGIYGSSSLVRDRIHEAAQEVKSYVVQEEADTSVGLRLAFWRASFEMLAEHPFTGVGAHNIQAEFTRRAEEGRMPASAQRYDHAHNDLIWILASYGLPGGIAWLLIYLVPLVCFVQAVRSGDVRRVQAGRLGLMLVLGYAVFGLTEAMFAITMNVAFYAVLLAVLLRLALPGRKLA